MYPADIELLETPSNGEQYLEKAVVDPSAHLSPRNGQD
jgi:hypothetical protein